MLLKPFIAIVATIALINSDVEPVKQLVCVIGFYGIWIVLELEEFRRRHTEDLENQRYERRGHRSAILNWLTAELERKFKRSLTVKETSELANMDTNELRIYLYSELFRKN